MLAKKIFSPETADGESPFQSQDVHPRPACDPIFSFQNPPALKIGMFLTLDKNAISR